MNKPKKATAASRATVAADNNNTSVSDKSNFYFHVSILLISMLNVLKIILTVSKH